MADPAALLFPGQGSQFVGMARDVYDAIPAARATIDQADEILGVSLSRLMFDGPEEELTRTDNAQPAIFVASVALLRCVQSSLGDVRFVAGHSVGELSALVAADALSFEDGLRLVRKRGEIMQRAGTDTPGGMMAVLGLTDDVLEAACLSVAPLVVCAANYNAPGQTIISGERAGLEAVTPLLKELGARRILPLNVSAAFHSPVMAPAAAELRREIEQAAIGPARWPVIGNVSATEVMAAADIKQELAEQIASPVRWHRSMTYALEHGVTRFIEIGPGKVLSGLMKRIDSQATVLNIGDLDGVQGVDVLAG